MVHRVFTTDRTSLHQGLVGLMNAGRVHEAHVTSVETGDGGDVDVRDVGREEKTQESSQETKEHHLMDFQWLVDFPIMFQ